MTETKPKRRWFQYSLRAVLAATLISGIAFGLVANHAHKRKSAVAVVRANGGTIEFGPDSVPTWYEKLFRQFFGPETYQPVRLINMLTGGQIERDKKKLPDDFLSQLSALPEIEFLGLENTEISESDWHNLSKFRKLKIIHLGNSNISDDGVKSLSELPELDTLSMSDTKGITDSALPYISKLPKLTNLKLQSTKITDQGLRTLSPHSELGILELRGLKVTSDGVELLKNIPTLKVVTLDWTDVDDRALDFLAALPELRVLQLSRTHVTTTGVQHFREVHPQCRVTGP